MDLSCKILLKWMIFQFLWVHNMDCCLWRQPFFRLLGKLRIPLKIQNCPEPDDRIINRHCKNTARQRMAVCNPPSLNSAVLPSSILGTDRNCSVVTLGQTIGSASSKSMEMKNKNTLSERNVIPHVVAVARSVLRI